MKLFGVQLWGRTDSSPVRRAMEDHRRAHPECEACGAEPVDIHHIIPVAIEPMAAGHPDNLISLCYSCHIAHGHAGDRSCRRFVPNIRKILKARKVVSI